MQNYGGPDGSHSTQLEGREFQGGSLEAMILELKDEHKLAECEGRGQERQTDLQSWAKGKGDETPLLGELQAPIFNRVGV